MKNDSKIKDQKSNIKSINKKSKVSLKEVKSKVSVKRSDVSAKQVKIVKKTASGKKPVKNETVEASVEIKKAEIKDTVSKKKSGIPKVKVFNKDGKVLEEIELPKEVFAAKINPVLMAQAVRVHLANQRMGTASTKTRGQVQGSTRKIYRQKGTGRARHGAITAPIFVGGGIVFGPRPRDYSLKLPQKMKKLALYSALSSKYANNQVIILDGLKDIKAKTKEFVKIIINLNLANKKKKGDNILFVLPEKIEYLEKSARNVEGVTIERAQLLNTFEVLKNKYILLLKESVNVIQGGSKI